MRPIQFSESVAVAPLPAFEQFSVESKFVFECAKRHKAGVDLRQVQTPCNFAKTIICHRPLTTSKRFISRLDLTPKLRPRNFAQTMYVFPKNQERTYTSVLRHHVEGRRKWYSSGVEMEPTVSCKLTPGRHNLDIDEKTGRIFRSEWTPISNGHILNGDVNYTDSSCLLVNGYNGMTPAPYHQLNHASGPHGFFDQDEVEDEVSI